MKTRRKAREAALQALYQCDTQCNWTTETVELYFQNFQEEILQADETQLENLEFSKRLVCGVIEHMDFLDRQIEQASLRWTVDRMSRVDRNIIRIALYEIAFIEAIPTNVSLNEAIEISKHYAADESPNFINGVLDHAARTFANNPELVATAVSPLRRVG